MVVSRTSWSRRRAGSRSGSWSAWWPTSSTTPYANRQDGAGSWIRLWTGLDGGRPVPRIAGSDGPGLGLSVVAAVAMAHGGPRRLRTRNRTTSSTRCPPEVTDRK
ncbi:hypothetical protein [Streptomyces sp. Ag82_O1-15]|uniref:hypothetical protein n=1 Tax=Streptomyces sp. Ag82_O1-15 TaxID=1938855 RepID=UPI00117F4ECC|nr:hypothetical protein [Streptomyces sp. Ag82_O1-15]